MIYKINKGIKMNIFVLDYNPQLAAEMHCDKHVVKMILETSQMICTVANMYGLESPYKTTHLNHPCTKWARESKQNMLWLFELLKALQDEWQYRFGHTRQHLSYAKLTETIDIEELADLLPNIGLTRFAQAMPDAYKVCCAVEAYRTYYKLDKAHLLQYTKRNSPSWLKDVL